MTKHHLAEQILQVVENCNTKDEQVTGIISLLDVLEPINLGQFANWGYPDQKSTPKECWAKTL